MPIVFRRINRNYRSLLFSSIDPYFNVLTSQFEKFKQDTCYRYLDNHCNISETQHLVKGILDCPECDAAYTCTWYLVCHIWPGPGVGFSIQFFARNLNLGSDLK